MEKANNNLIERYVYDVARRLPEKDREDVKKELRAHKLVSAAPPGVEDLQMIMEVRAYREKPSRKESAKGLAQALWAYLQAQGGQNPI